MYITWTNEEEFWRGAARSSAWRYRFLKWSQAMEQVDLEIGHMPDWIELKKVLQPGDLIWPFEFNQRTLAYRKGFVAIRKGKPFGGVVTILS